MLKERSGRFISPNDMMKEAKAEMLGGFEPKTGRDWVLVMNFIAANAGEGLEESICHMFLMLYDIPLSREVASEIAAFQKAAGRPCDAQV
jgi:hypothetical protein